MTRRKLSKNLHFWSSEKTEGFLNLGKFTAERQHSLTCDHGLVVMFQPLTGRWHQVIGVFASHSNVKADMLATIVLEAAIIMSENAGLRVDFMACDRAT